MSFTLRYFIVLLSLLSIFQGLLAQKVEIEKRISSDEFPAKSIEFLKDSFPDGKRIRYYKEISNTGISFEAKFYYSGTLYSVEFNSIGEWLDTELVIKTSDLDKSILSNISEYLNKRFRSYRIKKLQKQYSAAGIRFEAVVKGIKKGKPDFFEFLFDSEGHYLKDEVIIIENLSNEF